MRDLEKYEQLVMKRVKKIISNTAFMLQRKAREKAAKDTGLLKDSISVDIIDDGFTAIVDVGASYRIFLEWGTGIYEVNNNGRQTPWVYYDEKLKQYVFTRGMKAQPFWFDSVEEAGRYFARELNRL